MKIYITKRQKGKFHAFAYNAGLTGKKVRDPILFLNGTKVITSTGHGIIQMFFYGNDWEYNSYIVNYVKLFRNEKSTRTL